MDMTRGISGIPAAREREILSKATDELNKLWVLRDDYALHVDDPEELVRIAHVATPQCRYGFEVVHKQEIPSDDADFDVAGVIDRHVKQILIAQKFPLPCRRFTIAHEVGHLVLHPGRVYHRDRPLQGNERFNSSRPTIEKEADLFAAELLMPSKLLTDVFISYFGGRVDGAEANEDLCYYLSRGTGRRISPNELRSMKAYDRALLVAGASEFGTTMLQPLFERFSVSKSAMAIQLKDLKLVT